MDSILVLNTGSTSIKYKLFTISKLEEMQSDESELVGGASGVEQSFKKILRSLGDISYIKAIGHRVVHGGVSLIEPLIVDKRVALRLDTLRSLAPLHNPSNIAGIDAALEYLPDVPNIAVFDTAWYKDLPDVSKYYALPISMQEKLGIRRFGFHGISHQFAAEKAARQLKKPLKNLNLITIHLGGGSSITAVEKGKPIDTSMGFTPLEGLMMQSRAGDLDPGLVAYLASNPSINIDRLLNTESGIQGVSGRENYLDLLAGVKEKDEKALLAFDMYIYRIRKYIGAYIAALGSLDAIVFTGLIGAGEETTRKAVLKDLKVLPPRTKQFTIKPDEEYIIAKETKELLN